MTCFNAVHHFDLARFSGEASRVLTPSGQLVVYTRTPEQNRRTIWGRHFPEFATRETRLYEVNDVRAALDATGAFRSVRAQTVAWLVTTSLVRLVEQVTHYHYSTFRLYSEDACQWQPKPAHLWQPKTAHFCGGRFGRSGHSPGDARRAFWAGRRERSDRSPGTRREAAEPAVTVRLPHAVRPTLSSASADAPASGSCCPGC